MPPPAFQFGVEPPALRAPVDVELLQLEPLLLKRPVRLFGRLQFAVLLRMPLGAPFHLILVEPLPHRGPILAMIGQLRLLACKEFRCFQRFVVPRMPLSALRIRIEPCALRGQIAAFPTEISTLPIRQLQLL